MIQILLAYVLNAAWEVPLAALSAGLLCRVARLSPRARYLTCAGFLSLAVGLPAAQLRPDAQGLQPQAAAMPASPGRIAPGLGRPFAPSTVRASLPVRRRVAGLLVGAAALAAVAALVRLLVGMFAARALVRRSRPFRLPPAVEARLTAFVGGSGLALPAVRCSADVSGPAVVGCRPAVILVPRGFDRLPEGHACAALLHECAHVVRRDYALNLALEAMSAPLSWHPAVHLLKRRLGAAREAVCDQLAAAEIGSRMQYAERLVDLARSVQQSKRRRTGAALALFGRGELEARVGELVRASSVGDRQSGLRTAAAVAAGVAVVLPMALLHVSPAVERDATPSPSSSMTRPYARSAAAPAASRTTASLDRVRPTSAPRLRAVAWRSPEPAHMRRVHLRSGVIAIRHALIAVNRAIRPASPDRSVQVADTLSSPAVSPMLDPETPHGPARVGLVLRGAPAKLTVTVDILLTTQACALDPPSAARADDPASAPAWTRTPALADLSAQRDPSPPSAPAPAPAPPADASIVARGAAPQLRAVVACEKPAMPAPSRREPGVA